MKFKAGFRSRDFEESRWKSLNAPMVIGQSFSLELRHEIIEVTRNISENHCNPQHYCPKCNLQLRTRVEDAWSLSRPDIRARPFIPVLEYSKICRKVLVSYRAIAEVKYQQRAQVKILEHQPREEG
jgi:hypothetical protein